MTKQFKIIVEKHEDGYVAYPLGFKGVVVGEGDNYEEALADVKSAIAFYIETFEMEIFGKMSSHKNIKDSTLRTILTQIGISREEFISVYQDI